MNRLRLNLFASLLAVVGATIFILGNSPTAHAQISLIPAPSLQQEQPADIILSSETTLPQK